MNDIINKILMTNIKRGETLDTVKMYIKRRYNIVIDHKALKERLRMIKFNY